MKPVFLIISQVYVPDPAAVGQYLADAAAEMARRGYPTRHGYEDSSVVYPRREVRDGVEIRRLPLSSFGKDTINVRLLAQIICLLQTKWRVSIATRLATIPMSTAPNGLRDRRRVGQGAERRTRGFLGDGDESAPVYFHEVGAARSQIGAAVPPCSPKRAVPRLPKL